MTKEELLMEVQSLLHSSSDDDNISLLKGILGMAVYERVMYADNVVDLLTYMYDSLFNKADALNYVQCLYTVSDVYTDDEIIEYVQDNMPIEQVFNDMDIISYVTDNFDYDYVYDLADIIDEISANYPVEAVYDADVIKESVTSLNSLADIAEDYTDSDVRDFVEAWLDGNSYTYLEWLGKDEIMKYVKRHISINDYLLKADD